MESVIISKFEKSVADCTSFSSKKNGKTYFKVDFIVRRKDGENRVTNADSRIFDSSVLPASMSKLSPEEICQEFIGKKLVTTTLLSEK